MDFMTTPLMHFEIFFIWTKVVGCLTVSPLQTTLEDCDWFKDMKTSRGVFFFSSPSTEMRIGAARPFYNTSSLETGLAM